MGYNLLKLLEHAADIGYDIPCISSDGSIDLHAKSMTGDTLLHVAVGSKEPEIVEYLVGEGLDINARGDFFETPLYMAASSGDIEMVKLLLKLGADPDIPNNLGELPTEALTRKRDGRV